MAIYKRGAYLKSSKARSIPLCLDFSLAHSVTSLVLSQRIGTITDENIEQ